METIVSLIHRYPEGSFFIILAIIGAFATVGRAFANRNKPECHCDCCVLEDEDEDEEEE